MIAEAGWLKGGLEEPFQKLNSVMHQWLGGCVGVGLGKSGFPPQGEKWDTATGPLTCILGSLISQHSVTPEHPYWAILEVLPS